MFSTTCSMSLPGAAEICSCFQLKNRLEWNLRRHGPRPQIAEASPDSPLKAENMSGIQESLIYSQINILYNNILHMCIYIYIIHIADILVVWICSKESIEYHDGVRNCSMRFPVDFPINPMGQGAGASVEAHLAVTWHPKQSNTAKMAADCSICTKLWIYTMHIFIYIYIYIICIYIYIRERERESERE